MSAVLVLLLVCGAPAPGALGAQKSRNPLTETEIIELLSNEVPPARVEQLAREYGIAFMMNSKTENELQKAGATQELLKVLRDLAPEPPTSPTAPEPKAPPVPLPVLLIESKPGGAQVYADDEPAGKTSPEGRLKLSTLAPGEHRLRLALDGYRDKEQRVQLVAGETAQVTAMLDALEARSGCTGTFAGQWETTFGVLTIRLEGNRVSGSYTYNSNNGDITGWASGNSLEGEWVEVSSGGTGRGTMRFVLSSDGQGFTGFWRQPASGNREGAWNGRCLSSSNAAAISAPRSGVCLGTFAGQWTTTFGMLTIGLAGDRATGSYPRGKITGIISGNVLEGEWVEGSGLAKIRGGFRFLLSADGQSFTGGWGGKRSRAYENPWNGQCIAK